MKISWLLLAAMSYGILAAAISPLAAQNRGRVALAVTKAGPAAGVIVSSPPGIECGDDKTECIATFASGTPVRLTARELEATSMFAGWSGSTGSATCGAAPQCDFVIAADSTVTGTFQLQATNALRLTITLVGNGVGLVKSLPEGIQCGAGSGFCVAAFPPGTKVRIETTVDTDTQFQGWSGSTGSAQTCNNTLKPCEFTLDENSAVTANFGRQGKH